MITHSYYKKPFLGFFLKFLVMKLFLLAFKRILWKRLNIFEKAE